jgi:chromosomal replication initiator protein
LTNGVAILPLVGYWTADKSDLTATSTAATREFIVGPENRLLAATVERLLEVSVGNGLRAVPPDGSESTVELPNATECVPYRSAGATAAGEPPHPSPLPKGEGVEHLSPLVFCGASGTGKSHLAHGLAEAWQRLRPNDSVVLITTSEFTQQYAEAVEKRDVARWRTAFRSADLFVLEDLAGLSTKPAAQAELLHTLDALADRSAMVVVTSRLPPQDLTSFSAGLQSRLMAGLCVPLVLPETDARQHILAGLCEVRKIGLGDNSLRLLARSLVMSAPELAGVLAHLEHAARTAGQSFDDRFVQRFISQRNAARQPRLRSIAEQTARHFSLRMADLRSASRRRGVVVARDVAMYLARTMTSKSLKQIGDYFGGRDHTTVSHGCRKLETLMHCDAATHDAVSTLRQRLAMEE